MDESSSHDIVPGSDKAEDEGSAPSSKANWSATKNDIELPIAQMETPASSKTGAQWPTLDGTDDITDNAQYTTEAEPCQLMEITEPQSVFTTCHDGESNTFTIKSRGHSPVRHPEEAGASGEGGVVTITEKDDTPPHKDRDRTPEEIRRSPKRNKKLKIDKPGEL
jgi:hypothetical protein